MNKLLSLILSVAALAAPPSATLPTRPPPAEARVAAFKKMLRTFEPMGTVVRERDLSLGTPLPNRPKPCKCWRANPGRCLCLAPPWAKAAPNQKSGASPTPSRKNNKA